MLPLITNSHLEVRVGMFKWEFDLWLIVLINIHIANQGYKFKNILLSAFNKPTSVRI